LHGSLSGSWCLGVQFRPENYSQYLGGAPELIPYHYVVEGCLRVCLADRVCYELQAGDLALFPRNDYHLLGGDLSLQPVSGSDVVKDPSDGGLLSIDLDGDGPCTRIVCGFLAGDNLAANPVVCSLPALLRLDYREGSSADWIRSTFNYAADEIATGRIGSETVFAKLSELLFVEAIRRYVENLPEEQVGWLAGLKDPYISRALALLHARLRDPWTVDELGRETGLSRSALADRFNQVIGVPPMQYLTSWRMQVAAQELLNSSKSIAQIALETGYESEASLTRAFKRLMGAPPATWRRQRLAP
jgi:AraC-like DNA-binding protein